MEGQNDQNSGQGSDSTENSPPQNQSSDGKNQSNGSNDQNSGQKDDKTETSPPQNQSSDGKNQSVSTVTIALSPMSYPGLTEPCHHYIGGRKG